MPPVWYLGVMPLQEPFDVGLDDAQRQQVAFNVLATKRPSGSFVQELIALLVAAGVGIEGKTIFGTASAVLPTGPGPILSVKPTGGTGPLGTHNAGPAAYRRPGAQILVRAGTWAAADAMAQAAYDALVAVRNRQVVA